MLYIIIKIINQSINSIKGLIKQHLLNVNLRVGLCPKWVLVSGVMSERGFV